MKATFARRLLVAALAIALLIVGAACTTSQDAGRNPVLERKAAALTDLLARNNWSGIRKDFDANMRAGLSEASLASAWKEETAKLGAYKSRGESRAIAGPNGATAFDTPMVFERGELKSRFAFGPEGKVSGMFLLEPDET